MTKINNVCPKCGKSVSANSKFCNACGEKILENTSSAVDMLNKSTKIINTVTSTVSKVESTVNSAAKISSAADQISQIIVRPPAEWQVVVGDMIPVAGQKIVDAAVSTASAKIQQKVTAEVTKKVQDVIITAIPSNDDKKVIQEPVVESPSINTTATPVLSCPSCKSPINPGAKFCKKCGAKIGEMSPTAPVLSCPSCKSPINPGAKFCKKCGTKL